MTTLEKHNIIAELDNRLNTVFEYNGKIEFEGVRTNSIKNYKAAYFQGVNDCLDMIKTED